MAMEAVEFLLKAQDQASAVISRVSGNLSALGGHGAAAGQQLTKATTAASSGLVVMGRQGQAAGAAVSRTMAGLSRDLALVPPQVNAITNAFGSMGVLATPAILGVVGAVAAFTGAMLLGVRHARALGDEVERLSNLAAGTGASIQDLQVLGEVFKRAGLGVGAAESSLFRLNKAIAESNPLLAKLGITAQDPITALLQLSRVFQGSTDEAAKTKVAFELMGRGSADVLKVIDALAATFPGLRNEMMATSQLMTDDMVKAGKTFDDEWDKLAGSFEGAMRRIQNAAARALTPILQMMNAGTMPLPGFGFVGVGGKGEGGGVWEPAGKAGTKAFVDIKKAIDDADNAAKKLGGTVTKLPFKALEELRQAVGTSPATNLDIRQPNLGNLTPGAAVGEVRRVSEEMQGILGAMYHGVEGAFTASMEAMIAAATGAKVRITSIMRAMVSDVIRELARLAAASFFKFLLTLVTGGAAGAAAGAGAAGQGVGVIIPRAGGAGAPPGRAGEVNVNMTVNTIDSRSFTDFMTSPLGAGRLAEISQAASQTL